MKFAELETLLGDVDRARGIYELAIKQPLLDMPEILWKVNLAIINVNTFVILKNKPLKI